MASTPSLMELGDPESTPGTFLQTKKLFPRSDTYVYKQGDIIRFDFPNIGYVRPGSVNLTFRVKVNFPQGDDFYYIGLTNRLNFYYGGTQIFIQVPPGYYSGTTLASAIQALVLTAGIPNFTLAYSTVAKTFTFAQTVNGATITTLLSVNQGVDTLMYHFGNTEISANLFSSPQVISTSIFAITPADRFYNDTACMITKARFLYDEKLIEEIQELDVLQRWLGDISPIPGYHNKEGAILQNVGHYNERVDQCSAIRTNLKEFNIPLNFGWFAQQHPIALKYMASERLSVEFTLTPDIRVFTSFQAMFQTPQLQYDHMELNYDEMEFQPAVDKMYFDKIMKGGLEYKFASWAVDTYVPTSQNMVINLKYPQVSAAMVSIAGFITDTPQWISDYYDTFSYVAPARKLDVNVNASNSTALAPSYSPNNNAFVSSYKWRVDEKFYPVNSIKVHDAKYPVTYRGSDAAHALHYALKSVGKMRSDTDYRATNLSMYRWASPYQQINPAPSFLTSLTNYATKGNSDLTILGSESVSSVAAPCFYMTGDFQRSIDGISMTGVNLDKAKVVQLEIKCNDLPSAGLLCVIFMGYAKSFILKKDCAITVCT